MSICILVAVLYRSSGSGLVNNTPEQQHKTDNTSSSSPGEPKTGHTDADHGKGADFKLVIKIDTTNSKLIDAVRETCRRGNITMEPSTGQIVISGADMDVLKDYETAINVKITNFGKKYSHYVAIPIKAPTAAYDKFKKEALSKLIYTVPNSTTALNGPTRDYDPSKFFVPSSNLHLTVAMVHAHTKEQQRQLDQIMNAAASSLTANPFGIFIKKVGTFGDPKKARFAFGVVEDSTDLNELGKSMTKQLLKAGLTDTPEPVWHCTLINGNHFDRSHKITAGSTTFDAQPIIDNGINFGRLNVDKIQSKEMH